MKTPRRLAVVIGRFQPVHIFHVKTLLAHACQYDAVLVLLGSSLRATDPKNPFTWVERMNFIRAAAKDLGLDISHVQFQPIKDFPDSNPRWVFQVQKLVDTHCEALDALDETYEPGQPVSHKPVLVGIDKDDTSFYLKLFPHWQRDVFDPPPDTISVSATHVRDALFQRDWDRMAPMVTPTILRLMQEWLDTDEGHRIQEEFEAARRGRLVLARYDENGKLVEVEEKPTFHTADSVVLWRGHVLLVRRQDFPGKGLWALPSIPVKPNERIKAAAVRERQAELRVSFFADDTTKKRLHLHEDWCKASHVFDHPSRILNSRTITTDFLWVVPDEYKVEIEACQGADHWVGSAPWQALWFPLFADTQSIVAHFTLGAHR